MAHYGYALVCGDTETVQMLKPGADIEEAVEFFGSLYEQSPEPVSLTEVQYREAMAWFPKITAVELRQIAAMSDADITGPAIDGDPERILGEVF